MDIPSCRSPSEVINVEVVKALLAAGADVNAFGEWVPGCCQYLDTALHWAIRYMIVCTNPDDEHCTETAPRSFKS